MDIKQLALKKAKNHVGYIEPVDTLTLEGSSYYYGFLDGFAEGQMELLGFHEIQKEVAEPYASAALLLMPEAKQLNQIQQLKGIQDAHKALEHLMLRQHIISGLIVEKLGYHKAVEFNDEVNKAEDEVMRKRKNALKRGLKSV